MKEEVCEVLRQETFNKEIFGKGKKKDAVKKSI